MLKRSSFLTALGAGALAAPVSAADPAPVTVRLGMTPDVDVSNVIMQVPNGVLERLGMRLDGQRLGSGSAVTAAVIGGSIDIGTASIFGLINAHLRGVPIVLESVQAIYDASMPDTAFVVSKDSPITTVAQLNGATISVAALGDLFTIGTSAWVDANGGNSHTLNFVELPVPSAPAAIASGRITGALLVEPFLQDGIDRGMIRVLGHPYDLIAPRFGITYYFCSASFAASNADLLARFRRAIVQQVTYAYAHKSEIYALASKLSGTSLATVQHIPFVIGSGIDAKMIQSVIDYAARNKFIPKTFPATELIDPLITAR
jgi:NitT/TauT family transport system substrate-binding protein